MSAPLCKDCRWYERHESPLSPMNLDKCKNPFRTFSFVEFERMNDPTPPAHFGACGPTGKLFQPRLRWYRRVLARLTGRTT